jgi:hypothetical protein
LALPRRPGAAAEDGAGPTPLALLHRGSRERVQRLLSLLTKAPRLCAPQ